MALDKVIGKFLGRRGFSLSKDIPISYIIGKGSKYTFDIIRGAYRRIGLGDVGSNLMVGRHVSLQMKKNIFLGNSVRLEDGVKVDALSVGGVHMGNSVKIGSNSIVACTGSLKELGKGLSIGNNSSFSEYSYFGAAGGISIGNDVISGQNVRFHSENHRYKDKEKLIRQQGVEHKGIKIGNNVWIGAGAVFLDGAQVADGCVVAANSVVRGHYPENKVIGGVPSRILKGRFD